MVISRYPAARPSSSTAPTAVVSFDCPEAQVASAAVHSFVMLASLATSPEAQQVFKIRLWELDMTANG